MSRQRTSLALIGLLVLAVAFASVGCDKLNVKKLQANYYFNKANQLFRDAKFSKAIVEYENALSKNPSLMEAYRFLGESYKSLYLPGKKSADNEEKAAKALEALKKAFEMEPANKDIIYSLGDMYDKLRNFDEAEKMYLKIIDLEPGNMNNYYVIAEFYKRYAGDKKELKAKAEDMYLRRIETDPENVQGYAYMANYYDQLSVADNKGKFDQALTYHLMRKQIDPNSAEIYYTIGVNRFNKAFQLQNFLSQAEREALGAEAEQNLLKAIELDKNLAESYAYMKILYTNVHAKIYPEREGRYLELANQFGARWDEARKRQLEKMKLEKELKNTAGTPVAK
jgi:tetratricopeptide (TPR) repeat protein